VYLHFICSDWLRMLSGKRREGRVYLLSLGMVNDTKCAVNVAVNVETDVCK
jgi:hypothetical protein